MFRGEYLSPLSKRDMAGVARREQCSIVSIAAAIRPSGEQA